VPVPVRDPSRWQFAEKFPDGRSVICHGPRLAEFPEFAYGHGHGHAYDPEI
jgi:hypothetical protein